MAFVHEFGHVIFGTVMGGTLTQMQVAWFEIYPQPSVTSNFILGYVIMSDLESDFAYGLMGLGGSLTTNIVAWVIALTMLRIKFRKVVQNALGFLGLFGILDLPFYVVLPQAGFQHWVFLGGYEPEPLLMARLMGIPDPAFYLFVVFTTVGLLFFYYKLFLMRLIRRGLK